MKYGASELGYYYYWMQAEYFNLTRKPYLAQAAQLDLIEVLERSDVMGVGWRIADTYANLALEQMASFELKQAIESFEEAGRRNVQTRRSYFTAKEYEASALALLGENPQALELIDFTINNTAEDGTMHLYRRVYIKAHILFAAGNYKLAYQGLVQASLLAKKHRTGWNIGIRILHTLIHIERELHDQADAEIEALRKHRNRLEKTGQDLSVRDRLILEVLLKLSKAGYDFRVVNQKMAWQITKLSEVFTPASWVPTSHEKTPFHVWFNCKAKGQSYAFSLWPEAIAWQQSAPGSPRKTG